MLPLIFDSYYFIQQAVTIWIQGVFTWGKHTIYNNVV